jgi:branched-chain amino acid transport system ATP-binding protein
MKPKAIIETQGLVMRFGGVEVLGGIDFAIAYGELRCLIGPNGAGKSTFFKCITGQLKPTAGSIKFKDESVTAADAASIARRGMGIKTQVPSLYDGLTVREHIRLAASRRLFRHEVPSAVDEVLERFTIQHLAAQIVGRLAHGQRQLVEIAMVTASDPDLILLDEPAAGMTHQEVERLAELIHDLKGNHSLIIVEHDMQFIRMIAQEVTVFHQGRTLLEGDVQHVMSDERLRDVYLGRSTGE